MDCKINEIINLILNLLFYARKFKQNKKKIFQYIQKVYHNK